MGWSSADLRYPVHAPGFPQCVRSDNLPFFTFKTVNGSRSNLSQLLLLRLSNIGRRGHAGRQKVFHVLGQPAGRDNRYNPSMVKGIEHTAIASPDPHRLADWYVEHLDFVINYRSATNKTVFVKAADGSMLEIIESNTADRPALDMKAPGLRHVAITVTDFDAVYQRLKAKSVHFLGEPENKGGNSLVFFTDADGNILHLLQREKPLV